MARDTRSALLDAGADLFLKKGFASVGLREILESAGAPKGSFYHFFDSKESFAVAIIQRGAGCFAETLERRLTDPGQSPPRTNHLPLRGPDRLHEVAQVQPVMLLPQAGNRDGLHLRERASRPRQGHEPMARYPRHLHPRGPGIRRNPKRSLPGGTRRRSPRSLGGGLPVRPIAPGRPTPQGPLSPTSAPRSRPPPEKFSLAGNNRPTGLLSSFVSNHHHDHDTIIHPSSYVRDLFAGRSCQQEAGSCRFLRQLVRALQDARPGPA